MGVRFRGTFKPWIDDGGTDEVLVEIHDKQGGGNQEVRIESCHVFTESSARDPLSVFIPGRCEVSFLIEDDDMLTFITDIANQVEDRFFIIISEAGFQTFVGVVTHDFITYPDVSYPFPFTINAVDGLTRMKDVDYVDENGDPFLEVGTSNYFSCMDHIFNCFSKLNLDIYDNFFNSKHIWVHCNWYDVNMVNTSDNPLEMAFISSDLFYEYDNEGNLLPDSCFEVLKTILTAFGMQVKYAKGIYLMWQPSSLTTGSNFYWNYQVDGTPSGTRNQSFKNVIDKETIYPKYQGNWHFLSAIRQVKVIYSYDKEVLVQEPPDSELAWGTDTLGGGTCWRGPDEWANAGNPIRPIASINKPDIDGAPVWRFHAQLFVKTTMDNGEFYEWLDHKYFIDIKLGIAALEGNNNFEQFVYQRQVEFKYDGAVVSDPEWVSESFRGNSLISNIGYMFVTPAITNDFSGARGQYFDIGFETIPFPGAYDLYEPHLCVFLNRVITANDEYLPLDAGTSPDLSFSVEMSISDIKIIIAKDNKNAKPTIETVEHESIINEGGKDSVTINTRIGDRGTISAILVDNDGAGDLKTTGGWGVGAGSSDVIIGDLLAQEYHKVRGNAIRIMNRTIIGRENLRVDASTFFDYDSAVWLSMNTDHDYYSQEITGSWWALRDTLSSPQGATLRSRAIGKRYNRLDQTLGDIGTGDPRYHSVGTDGNGFTAPATEYVFDDNGVLLPNKDFYSVYQIGKMVDVQINGNHLRYVDENPTGPREYTIDNDNNSIVVDSNFPLTERHDIQVFLRKVT